MQAQAQAIKSQNIQSQLIDEDLKCSNLNRQKEIRPFFKDWLKKFGYYEQVASLAKSDKKASIQDFIVCWIYGKDAKDQYDVRSAHNIFYTELEEIKDMKTNNLELWEINKKRNFEYYNFIKACINDGTFFDVGFNEKEIYQKIKKGESPYIKATQYQIDL